MFDHPLALLVAGGLLVALAVVLGLRLKTAAVVAASPALAVASVPTPAPGSDLVEVKNAIESLRSPLREAVADLGQLRIDLDNLRAELADDERRDRAADEQQAAAIGEVFAAVEEVRAHRAEVIAGLHARVDQLRRQLAPPGPLAVEYVRKAS